MGTRAVSSNSSDVVDVIENTTISGGSSNDLSLMLTAYDNAQSFIDSSDIQSIANDPNNRYASNDVGVTPSWLENNDDYHDGAFIEASVPENYRDDYSVSESFTQISESLIGRYYEVKGVLSDNFESFSTSSINSIKTINSFSSSMGTVLSVAAVDSELFIAPAMVADTIALGSEVTLLFLGERGEIASIVDASVNGIVEGTRVETFDPKSKTGIIYNTVVKELVKVPDDTNNDEVGD